MSNSPCTIQQHGRQDAGQYVIPGSVGSAHRHAEMVSDSVFRTGKGGRAEEGYAYF